MRLQHLDQMIDRAVGELASGDDARIHALVRDLATDWPNQPALAISFALSSAAASLEDIVADGTKAANLAYRLAALVAADILAIEAMGQQPAQTQHLLHFWRRVDPYFLKL